MTINDLKVVEKIRNSYTEKSTDQTELDKLKSLNRKVKTPANVFAYIFGIIGTLVLGTGMCFAMEVLGNIMWLGIVVGVVGIVMVSITYPIYKAILAKRKAKYADEIIKKSNEILNKGDN